MSAFVNHIYECEIKIKSKDKAYIIVISYFYNSFEFLFFICIFRNNRKEQS